MFENLYSVSFAVSKVIQFQGRVRLYTTFYFQYNLAETGIAQNWEYFLSKSIVWSALCIFRFFSAIAYTFQFKCSKIRTE